MKRGRSASLATKDETVSAYTVEIGAGALGLVLELDHSGRAVVYQVLSPGPLVGHVRSGDILTHINGKSLHGRGTREVVDMCHKFRNKKKILSFLYGF